MSKTLLDTDPEFVKARSVSRCGSTILVVVIREKDNPDCSLSLGVYAYRDVYPLITYDLSPQDEGEGPWIWVKVALLLFTGVIIPLLTPGVYVPVDDEDPMPMAHPLQTSSPLSAIFYFYMDSVVARAYKEGHLPTSELPPLADVDMAKNLKKKYFKHFKADQHLFFWLLRIFRWDLFVMTLVIQMKSLGVFASPLAINQILLNLQAKGEHQWIRPWFWIILLFIAVVVETISVNCFMFLAQRILVRTESILTELLFEHALKIRIHSPTNNAEGDEDNGANTSGRLNTLVTVDLNAIAQSADCLFLFVYVPTQVVLCTIFLYKLLGWTAFVGIGVTIATIPIPSTLVGWIHRVQVEQMKKTDARVQVLSDVLHVLKMAKLFGWERRLSEQVSERRKPELALVKKSKIIDVFFNIVRRYIQMAFVYAVQVVGVKVAFDRVNEFLHEARAIHLLPSHILNHLQSELLDEFVDRYPHTELSTVRLQDKVGFNNASFTWTTHHDSNAAYPSRDRQFMLKIPGELLFKRGAVNLVHGPTGSGKTSLLLALLGRIFPSMFGVIPNGECPLGEMHFVPIADDSWYHVPREGGVAYAAQEAWVLNETIKENILFGSPYDETRYNTVLHQCALERDLSLLSAGDSTEVGERGITLSGGQKARISLARAVYSSAEILLLDDILAALEFLVSVQDGIAAGSEPSDEQLNSMENGLDTPSVECAVEDSVKTFKGETEAGNGDGSGRLILAEEIEVGRAGWSSGMRFFKGNA
ncbi:hypothetical protein VNI00_010463 [Paramarasmius palmivorus]|uniref:Uncharacterized protein n=1 Tax=Paramarasmius palmivorus TaxID=297713 RepID=A0AAW0CGX1_9AGAR